MIQWDQNWSTWGVHMREIRINMSEDTYRFYEKIGRTMDSSAEEVMEMMLRVCVSRIKKKKKEKSDWL